MLTQLKTALLREGIDITQLPLTMDSAYVSQALRERLHQLGCIDIIIAGKGNYVFTSTVVFWRVPNELVYCHGSLLLGKQIGKDIFHPLPELEALVRIQDQRLHECLGLLTTRFPDGFEGQAAFCR